MLTLTRKPGEAVHILGPCTVTYKRRGVLGVEAAPGVPIVRAELVAEQRPTIGTLVARHEAPQAWLELFADMPRGNVLALLPPDLVGVNFSGYITHRMLGGEAERLYLVLLDAPGVVAPATAEREAVA